VSLAKRYAGFPVGLKKCFEGFVSSRYSSYSNPNQPFGPRIVKPVAYDHYTGIPDIHVETLVAVLAVLRS